MNESVETKYDKLLELGVSEQTIKVVTDINGTSDVTMEDILYSWLGVNSFDKV